jgi:hypothetical protein
MTNSTAGTKVAVQLVLQVKGRATVPRWGPEMSSVGRFMSAEGGSGSGQPTAKWTVMTQRELSVVVGVPDPEYADRSASQIDLTQAIAARIGASSSAMSKTSCWSSRSSGVHSGSTYAAAGIVGLMGDREFNPVGWSPFRDRPAAPDCNHR